MLFGADLPDGVIVAFERQVGDPAWAYSSDAIELGKSAKALVRAFGLDRVTAPDEFLKLALDLGVGTSKAVRVSRMVAEVR
jgi:hypothetical protein